MVKESVPDKFCKYCKEQMDFIDDSFSHQFGVSIDKFWQCEDCTREVEYMEGMENDADEI